MITTSRGRTRCAITLIRSVTVVLLALSTAVSLAESTAEPTALHPKSSSSAASSATIGLVLTSWRPAFVESDYGREECPDGLQPGEREQFLAMKNLDEHVAAIGPHWETRGPNGEFANNNPLIVEDPLPFRELKTPIGYGFNLDGTEDGRATAKSCAHEKFTSPDGEKVDHQLARVLGCVTGWRTGGQTVEFQAEEFRQYNVNRILIEITGIDDETNDPAVIVAIYKGIDALVPKADGGFVPYTVQRVDQRFPQYHAQTTGKIVDGVLITEPIADARLASRQESNLGDRIMKDLSLRLKLTVDGAEGLLGGYQDWDKFWVTHSKKLVSDISLYSGAGVYRALVRYADGYPDPKTGRCGFISSAYKIEAVRAMIVGPEREQAADAARYRAIPAGDKGQI